MFGWRCSISRDAWKTLPEAALGRPGLASTQDLADAFHFQDAPDPGQPHPVAPESRPPYLGRYLVIFRQFHTLRVPLYLPPDLPVLEMHLQLVWKDALGLHDQRGNAGYLFRRGQGSGPPRGLFLTQRGRLSGDGLGTLLRQRRLQGSFGASQRFLGLHERTAQAVNLLGATIA